MFEREFEILGEAMGRLLRAAASVEPQITHARRIIGLRNILSPAMTVSTIGYCGPRRSIIFRCLRWRSINFFERPDSSGTERQTVDGGAKPHGGRVDSRQ